MTQDAYNTYRSIYCSLCHALESKYGQLPRFLLSFDITCMALFAYALAPQIEEEPQLEACYGKLGKRSDIYRKQDFLAYCADVSVLLAEQKLLDDRTDNEHLLRTYGLQTLLSNAFHQAEVANPQLAAVVSAKMAFFNAMERQLQERRQQAQTAEVAELIKAPTNALLLSCLEPLTTLVPESTVPTLAFAELCRLLWRKLPLGKNKASLGEIEPLADCVGEIGALLGAYIYLMDAASDLPQDIKNKKFNILLQAQPDLACKIKPKRQVLFRNGNNFVFSPVNNELLTAEQRSMKLLLNGTELCLQKLLHAVDAAAELLPFRRSAFLIANIIKDGLPRVPAHHLSSCRFRLGLLRKVRKQVD